MRHGDDREQPARVSRSKLAPAIGREREAVEQQLEQARRLLRDGMDKLHGFFETLRTNVEAQTGLLTTLRDETLDPETRKDALIKLLGDQQHVRTQSESAILGLQLEDMLGQLLDFTRQRVDSLSVLASALADAVDIDALAKNPAAVERVQNALQEVHRMAGARMVNQQNLDVGDIELF
jgi:hypothetical protein